MTNRSSQDNTICFAKVLDNQKKHRMGRKYFDYYPAGNQNREYIKNSQVRR